MRYTDGISNWDVAQRESEMLDVMTANRGTASLGRRQGRDLKVDDSNTPPLIPVKTNFPGKTADGTHIFLAGDEEVGAR